MKLSEAIRLGAMLRPQAFTSFDSTKSCAVEAACDAIGEDRSLGYAQVIYKYWPWVKGFHGRCPSCSQIGVAEYVFWHLNDGHRWTREQVAEFVASVEPPTSALETVTREVEGATVNA